MRPATIRSFQVVICATCCAQEIVLTLIGAVRQPPYIYISLSVHGVFVWGKDEEGLWWCKQSRDRTVTRTLLPLLCLGPHSFPFPFPPPISFPTPSLSLSLSLKISCYNVSQPATSYVAILSVSYKFTCLTLKEIIIVHCMLVCFH